MHSWQPMCNLQYSEQCNILIESWFAVLLGNGTHSRAGYMVDVLIQMSCISCILQIYIAAFETYPLKAAAGSGVINRYYCIFTLFFAIIKSLQKSQNSKSFFLFKNVVVLFFLSVSHIRMCISIRSWNIAANHYLFLILIIDAVWYGAKGSWIAH